LDSWGEGGEVIYLLPKGIQRCLRIALERHTDINWKITEHKIPLSLDAKPIKGKLQWVKPRCALTMKEGI